MGRGSEISEIACLVGIRDPGPGIGSSVYKDLFNGICARFDIEGSGSMPQQAQQIVTAAKLPYNSSEFDRDTPSRGGSTVTLAGLQQIKQAVLVLLAQN